MHVFITSPAKSGSLFLNYKHTFSISLIALVGANYRFIFVDIGQYGNNTDGPILHNLAKCLYKINLMCLDLNPCPMQDILETYLIW